MSIKYPRTASIVTYVQRMGWLKLSAIDGDDRYEDPKGIYVCRPIHATLATHVIAMAEERSGEDVAASIVEPAEVTIYHEARRTIAWFRERAEEARLSGNVPRLQAIAIIINRIGEMFPMPPNAEPLP